MSIFRFLLPILLVVIFPAAAPPPISIVPGGAWYSNRTIYYRVRDRDTLYDIARLYLPHTDFRSLPSLVQVIMETNHLPNSMIHMGQVLAIPVWSENRARDYAWTRDPVSDDVKGIYLTAGLAGSPAGQALMDQFARVGGNTIFFDIKETDGFVHFPMTTPLSRSIESPRSNEIPDLHRLLASIHDRKMRAVARVVCFADRRLFLARPEYRLRDERFADITDGPWVCWVDPGNPNVRGYLLDLVMHLCAVYAVDEIHLDYVRYPDVPDPVMRMGAGIPRDDSITEFVREVQRVTQKYRRRLSLAIFGIMAWDRGDNLAITGQNIRRLSAYSDGIHLMLYPSHFAPGFAGFANPADHPQALVPAALRNLKTLSSGRALSISPWLQAFDLSVTTYDAAYVRSSMEAARNSGTGFLFWNSTGRYQEVFEALGPRSGTRAGGTPSVNGALTP